MKQAKKKRLGEEETSSPSPRTALERTPLQHPKDKRTAAELQGLTNASGSSQRPPEWERPAGSEAADLLDTLLAPKVFEIWTERIDGRRSRLYQAYRDRAVADGVVARLREFGLPCAIRVRLERPT